MPAYQVYLFGAPRLEYQEQQVSIDTRKALALLAYLLINGEPYNRDTLATLLWPESDQKSARAALRRTLSTLRSVLDEKMLDFGRKIIAIHQVRELWCDVTEFQSLINEINQHGHPVEQVCERCFAPLQQAAELYKADFMAGFSLRDSAAFDDWQFFEADRLRRELGSVLERLISLYGNQGDFPAAIDIARRWLTLDTLNEATHRALILLYAQNGQRNAALRQYRECVRILDQELGVPPLSETTHLYEAVKENLIKDISLTQYLPGLASQPQMESDQQTLGKYQPASPEDYPLVGRNPEWEELSRLYGDIDQDGVFVAITGEIGVGKSHLAQEFLTHLQKRGAIALTARCYSGESNLAYTPITDLLRQGINQAKDRKWWQGLHVRWLNEISLLMPEISEILLDLPPSQRTGGPGAQNRFFEAVCQIFTAMVHGTKPGIIFIDNLEWVDESTLDLLAYLVRRLRGRPVLILAAWDAESTSTTAVLEQVLIDAALQGRGNHLPLSALQPSQSHELVDQITQEDLTFSLSFKDQLVEVSDGLPYLLVEYVRSAMKGEISSEVATENWPLPAGLRGLLLNRLVGLSGSAHQILQAAAVIGHTFTIELLQSTSGRTEEEIIQGIEELLNRNLIMEVLDQTESDLPTVRYDFKHDQVRELILEELSLARARVLHRRTAEALEDQERIKTHNPLSGQIAYHYHQAGSTEKAAGYYFQAGLLDRNMQANSDALTHFQAALALGYPQKPDILVELGDLFTLKGDYPQAIQNFEAAAAYDVPTLLPTIEQKIGQVYLRRGQWEQAACHLEAALVDLSAYPAEKRKAFEARVDADLSLVFHRRGQTGQAESLANKALELAEAGADPLALAQTHNLLGILARSNHQYQLALEHLEQSLNLAYQIDDPQVQIAAFNNLALAQADLDDLQAASEIICQAIDESLTLGDRHLEAALRSNYADILRANQHTDAAMQQLKEAAAIFAEIGQNVEDWEPEIWKLVEW